MFDPVISSLPAFVGYFAAALVLLSGCLALYLFVTPYDELALIREGNVAAALSLAGAMLGFALPIAVSVVVSHSPAIMAAWGLVASVSQLLAYVVARLAWPQINQAIIQGKLASGIFLASLSLAVGVLNAGCIA